MPDVSFGGGSFNSWFDYSNQVLSTNINVPARRTAANGKGPQLITQVAASVAGYTTSVTLKLYADGNKSSTITRSADSTPGSTGLTPLTSDLYIANGTTVSFGISNNSDGIYFNRSGSGSTSISPNGYSWGGTLGGSYRYKESPSAPRTLTATPSTTVTGQVSLSWLSPSDDGGTNVTNYNVYTVSGSTYTLLGTTTGTTFSAAGLTGNTSYTFAVRARNAVTDTAGTQSVDSNLVTATAPLIAPPVSAPGAPTALSATTSTTVLGSLDLSWTAPANTGGVGITITGYDVYINGVYSASTVGTGTTYTVTGLAELSSSSFTVLAKNSGGFSGPQSTAVVGKASGLPTSPTGLTAIADTLINAKINLSWSAPSDSGGGISGYRIYDASTNVLIRDQSGTGTTYSDDGSDRTPSAALTVGQEYSYYVRAYNAIGIAQTPDQYSPASGTVSETAVTVTGAPYVVPSTTVAGRVTLTWVATAGATSYTVTNKNTAQSVVVSANVTTYVWDGLTGNTQYGFTKTPNNGAESEIGYGTPLDTSVQTLGTSTAITNNTNTQLSTTSATITGVQTDSFTYAKTVDNFIETQVSAEAGSAVATNKTNQRLTDSDGVITATIDSVTTGASPSFTYLLNGTAVTATSASGVLIANISNTGLSTPGVSVTVPAGTPPITTFSYLTTTYAGGALNIASGGSATNLSQTTFNVTQGPVTAVTDYTLSYARSASDQDASAAIGTIINATNQQVFNKNAGNDRIRGIPDYKTIKYAVVGGLKASISATAQATTVVTVTTASEHYFQSGDTVTIQGSTNGSGVFNGQWTINPPASATTTERSAYTVTVNTGTAHGLVAGDPFVISGSTNSGGIFNGTWEVATAPSTTQLTFTHTDTGTVASASDTAATVTATKKFRFTRGTSATISSAADTAATADVDISTKTVANPTDSVTRLTTNSGTRMEVTYRSGWIG